jgi:DNA-binding transcriptional regulator YiaG
MPKTMTSSKTAGKQAEKQSSRARRAVPKRNGRNIGDEIIAGLEEAIAFERGEKTGARFKPAPIRMSARNTDAAPAPDYTKEQVAKIRAGLQLSQPVFAKVLNVSSETAKAWEQGKVPPSGSAKRLLQIAERHPDVVLELVVRK